MSVLNDIVVINDCIPRHKHKYDFVDSMLCFNSKVNPDVNFHYISNKPTVCTAALNHSLSTYKDDRHDEFRENYVHLNNNPYEFELACFLRWITLINFMTANSLERVLYLDNDVAVYTPTAGWPQEILACDYSLSQGCSPHTNFLTSGGLNAFIEFFTSAYSDKEGPRLARLKEVRREFIARGDNGGVGDLFLWSQFINQDRSHTSIRDISQVFPERQTFDHHISHLKDYESKNNYKNIKFQDWIPYCYNTKTQTDIRFNTLHFQGGAKCLIDKYL